MIDERDIENYIEVLLEELHVVVRYPQSPAEVIYMTSTVVEHGPDSYHRYSFQFVDVYAYNSEFCPRYVRDLRRAAMHSIDDSARNLGGFFTLDCQLHWNVSENRAEMNSYIDDITLSDRYD